ncbi:MAG: ribonuclease HII [Spirochaetaceae bacterium]|jgi:ribonuclease HII|nr:ribonuclease HII [Spirochaetaceae bacterium]
MICGIDEVGRGPLAGPVCAAAVVLPENFPIEILDDSKKLSEKKREEIGLFIVAESMTFGIGWAGHAEIDEINILQASLLAMHRAYEEMLRRSGGGFFATLEKSPSFEIIVDGNKLPLLARPYQGSFLYAGDFSCRALVKADTLIPQVMAASILAKNARDTHMRDLARHFPQYGYEKHKGYPTRDHIERIKKFGPSPVQRYSFRVEGEFLERRHDV